MNHKRVLRAMRERGLLVRPRRLRARRRKEWGRVEASRPNEIWQSDMTKVWAGLRSVGPTWSASLTAAHGRSWAGICRIAAGPEARSRPSSQRALSSYFANLTIVLRVSVVFMVTTAGPPLYMCQAAYCSL